MPQCPIAGDATARSTNRHLLSLLTYKAYGLSIIFFDIILFGVLKQNIVLYSLLYLHHLKNERVFLCYDRNFLMMLSVNFCTDASCDDSFQLNSQCYKVHKNEKVCWFTAVNRCMSNNASLAVFDDDIRQYFPSSVLSDYAWIGLVKSWWTWPDLGKFQLGLKTYVEVLPIWCCLFHWTSIFSDR